MTKFSGHALLRGVVWVENGSMLGEAGIRELPYLELRDRELPYALAVQEPGQALVLDGDPAESSLKVLIRPEGSGFCVKPMDGSLACTGLQYSPLSPAGRVVVAGTTLRFVFFEIPDWVESR
ncbi:MAG: hypothetical protein KC729_04055 [Candidatus Eisenbacteria bacterium]|uniref:Uncharacterized protein n=1 Tax=Eiseniibacteriota bacterium TaxID=2212470 RepID=A0A956LY93_UNCEI|nr:hypothetical protein [Candidatus Eisenbacteria bacterium]